MLVLEVIRRHHGQRKQGLNSDSPQRQQQKTCWKNQEQHSSRYLQKGNIQIFPNTFIDDPPAEAQTRTEISNKQTRFLPNGKHAARFFVILIIKEGPINETANGVQIDEETEIKQKLTC